MKDFNLTIIVFSFVHLSSIFVAHWLACFFGGSVEGPSKGDDLSSAGTGRKGAKRGL